MDIKAAIATAPDQPFQIKDVQLDNPRDNEILVKVKGVGICHTDLVAKAGVFPPPHPSILGHEGSGIVEKIGSAVTSVAVGDHVVLSFVSCRQCSRCTSDSPSYCENFAPLNILGTRTDSSYTVTEQGADISANFFGQSSFATYALTHESNTVKVDKSLPIELLGPLGCGIQTGAGSIINAMACKQGSSIAIYGGGSVGLSAVLGAVVQKCATIILVEPMESRRQLALSLGATHTIDPTTDDVATSIRDICEAGVNYGLDSTGISQVIEAAIASLAPRGELGLVGTVAPGSAQPSFDPNAMLEGKTIRGIVEGEVDPLVFIPTLLEHYKNGNFPFDRLITTYPFDQINEAIDAQHRGECVKPVLVVDQ
jgi:aryl-alcohol dehydrogenase